MKALNVAPLPLLSTSAPGLGPMAMARWRVRRSGRHHTVAVAVAAGTLCGLLLDSGLRSSAAVPAGPTSCTSTQRRQWLVSTVGAAAVAEALSLRPAHASSLATPFGIPLDLSFLDPPAPPDVAQPPPDAQVTPSGLASKILLRPSCALSKSTSAEDLAKCPHAKPYDKVVIDYTGWQTDGKMFDSSRLEKRTIRVNSVMPGWTEGLQLMSPGETRRFWVPASLAYGDNPASDRPAGTLVFDVVLYSIDSQPKPPDNLTGPPAEAAVTSSGLSYQLVKAGSGSRNPLPESSVTVSYSGWQTNGELFMSSSLGAPKTFKVNEIPIKGLAEGVQMMVEGEVKRFWIPAQLAFGDKPASGLPAGMLVFEVELSRIE